MCVCMCLYSAANSNASNAECLGSNDEMAKAASMVTPQAMQNSAPEISQGFGIGKSVETHPSSEISRSSVIAQSAGIPQSSGISQSSAYPQSVQRISGWSPVII